MTAWSWSYFIGAVSGLFFILLGAYAAFDPKRQGRYTLPLVFGSLGAQFAFTNLAAASTDPTTAHGLFAVGAILVPLPGLLLLYYAIEQTVTTHPRLCQAAKVALILGILSALGAAVLALIHSSLIQTSVDSSINPGPYYGLLTAPKWLGVAVALVILSAAKPDKQGLLLGLGIAGIWAYSAGTNFGGEIYAPLESQFNSNAGPRPDFLLIYGAATLLSAVVVPIQLTQAAKRLKMTLLAGILSAVVLALGLVAVFVASKAGDSNLFAHPGLTRIILAGILLWALHYPGWRPAIKASPSSIRVPVIGTALALTIAIAVNVLAHLSSHFLDDIPSLAASTMTIGGLASIGIFSLAAVTQGVRARLHPPPLQS